MATMTKPPGAKKTSSVLVMVSGLANAAPKSDRKPEVRDEALNPLIEKWLEKKRAMDDAEAAFKDVDDQLIAEVRPKRLEACRRLGKVESSIRVNGKVTMTQKCQYSKIPADREDDLATAFGEKASVYFPPKLSLSLTDAAADDEAVLQALVDALGPARFGECFRVERCLLVSEAFHMDLTLSEEVEQLAAPFTLDQTIKAYKPQLRQ